MPTARNGSTIHGMKKTLTIAAAITLGLSTIPVTLPAVLLLTGLVWAGTASIEAGL